jgi:hypothetical protein
VTRSQQLRVTSRYRDPGTPGRGRLAGSARISLVDFRAQARPAIDRGTRNRREDPPGPRSPENRGYLGCVKALRPSMRAVGPVVGSRVERKTNSAHPEPARSFGLGASHDWGAGEVNRGLSRSFVSRRSTRRAPPSRDERKDGGLSTLRNSDERSQRGLPRPRRTTDHPFQQLARGTVTCQPDRGCKISSRQVTWGRRVGFDGGIECRFQAVGVDPHPSPARIVHLEFGELLLLGHQGFTWSAYRGHWRPLLPSRTPAMGGRQPARAASGPDWRARSGTIAACQSRVTGTRRHDRRVVSWRISRSATRRRVAPFRRSPLPVLRAKRGWAPLDT